LQAATILAIASYRPVFGGVDSSTRGDAREYTLCIPKRRMHSDNKGRHAAETICPTLTWPDASTNEYGTNERSRPMRAIMFPKNRSRDPGLKKKGAFNEE
jgi:hypothetical protein